MTPRIAIPIPTSFDPDYNQRAWPQYARAIERAGGEPVPVPLDQPPAETARLLTTCTGVLLPGSGADVNPQKYGAAPDPHSAAPDPARENVDELLLQDAHNLRKPILAICFGAQMLNVWRGGTLIQDLPTAQPASPVNHKAGRTVAEAHPAEIAPNTLLAAIVAPNANPTQLPVNSSHHQAIAVPAEAAKSVTLALNSSHHQAIAVPAEAASHVTLVVNSSHHQAIATPGDGLRVSARSPQDGVIEAVEGALGTPTAHPPFILGIQWHPERTYDESPASRALFTRLVEEARTWSPRSPELH